ncbi:amidase [Brevibacillus daliensis]|uniref:amidase n=1 Tax=Brevibacillus daliensis TaxID=2892995 RepID=UPI001E2EDDF8|nr:amidase [Brevibacillus daliensis]
MTDLLFRDITTIHQAITSKKLSPVELIELTQRRIEEQNPTLRAFICVQNEGSMKAAKQAENEIMKGEVRGKLHGIPLAIKDVIHVKGTPTTGGSRLLRDWWPDEDATVVSKLKAAGAIIVGKANLHEFAMGATSENPHFGTVRNPWDHTKISGGSSGGSAVAVATGMSVAALGTDTAGSIRLPAALTGTVGLKPTYGLVSRHGSLPFSWSFDHIGPMTRTVRDAALMLEVIAGYDPLDAATTSHSSFQKSEPLFDLSGVTIGICRSYFFENIEPELNEMLEEAMSCLEKLGARLVFIELPFLDEAGWAQKIIGQSEGYSFHEPFLRDFKDLYGPDVLYRLNFGSNVTASEYLKAQRIRHQFIQSTLAEMKEVDLLLSPMNHSYAFEIGSVSPEQSISNMFRLAKAPLISLLGFPALALQSGFTHDGMPAGMQLIAKPFEEARLLAVGECYERETNWAARLPLCLEKKKVKDEKNANTRNDSTLENKTD